MTGTGSMRRRTADRGAACPSVASPPPSLVSLSPTTNYHRVTGRREDRRRGRARSTASGRGTSTPSPNNRRESMTHRLFIIPALFTALLITGCATKKFVREELQKVETKTGQSVSRIDGEIGQERGRVDGLTVQVTDVGKRADQANGLAGQAANRAEAAAQKSDQANGAADQALQRADQTDTRLTRLWANRHKLNPADTIVIRFGFDRAQLDDRGLTSLLQVA